MTPEHIFAERMNARLEAVEAQRNDALADHAIAMGELSVEQKKNVELSAILKDRDATIANLDLTMQRQSADIAALQAEVADLKKPKEG